jgi:hypothetical protein
MKRSQGRIPKYDLATIAQLYEIYPIKEVAQMLGMTPSAIQARLANHGIPRRPVGRPPIDEELSPFDQFLLGPHPKRTRPSPATIASWRQRRVKRCNLCGIEKALDQVWQTNGALGRHASCRECATKQARLRARHRYRTDELFRAKHKSLVARDRKTHWIDRGFYQAGVSASDRGATLDLNRAQWRFLVGITGDRCVGCGRSAQEIQKADGYDIPLTPEHVRPIAHKGTHDISNVQPMCPACNRQKGLTEIDFLAHIRPEIIRSARSIHSDKGDQTNNPRSSS